jgi:predicted nucleic acid-binding protein
MIVVDSSVLVSMLRATDRFHAAATKWFAALDPDSNLHVPDLALVEVAAVLSRSGVSEEVVKSAISSLEDLLEVQATMDCLESAVKAATAYRLRGADAVFVGLAWDLDGVLVTLDREQHDKAKSCVEVVLLS